jgi:hypothetical protein
MKRWTCTDCKLEFPPTSTHWYQSQIDKVDKNPNRFSIGGKCKPCSREYGKKYRAGIKQKGLVRSQRTTSVMAGAITGTIYVIGPDLPETPYKIGVTSGADTRKRKTALQTAHWMDLKEVWKSTVLTRADIIEGKLHKHFEKKRVRGEWFNIGKAEIEAIPELIEKFKQDLENK